jgi:hypothetical protein
MGRRNVKGTKFDKESYSYYNKLWNANKSYYKKMGYNDLIPYKMNKEQWEFKKKSTEMSNKDIVFEEFHKYTREQTENLVEQFRLEGVKVNKAKIARGEFNNNQWNIIKQNYHEVRAEGMSSGEAKTYLSYLFWGSL